MENQTTKQHALIITFLTALGTTFVHPIVVMLLSITGFVYLTGIEGTKAFLVESKSRTKELFTKAKNNVKSIL